MPPPFTSLLETYNRIKNYDGSVKIKLASQNVYYEKSGAYTGEISIQMIKECGCGYAIVGHSERRWIFNETEEINVVIFGPAVVSLLRHSQLKEQLRAVLTNKVSIFVCRNAMNMFELKDGDIPDYAKIVPAGVEKIAKLAKEGCVYISL